MKFETFRYGTINIQPEDIYTFPEGLLGFPNCNRFTLIDEESAAPFRILQSLDISNLAFVVIDPLIVKPDYHFKLTLDDLKVIKTNKVENVSVYSIVNLAKDIKQATINLQGPLVLNSKEHLGHQFVLFDESYSVSEKLVTKPIADKSTKLKKASNQ